MYVWVLYGKLFWTSEVSSNNSIPTGFLQPEVMRTYLPGTGTLVGGPSVGLGLLAPEISLLNFYPPHVGVGPACSTLHPSYQSGWMWFLLIP